MSATFVSIVKVNLNTLQLPSLDSVKDSEKGLMDNVSVQYICDEHYSMVGRMLKKTLRTQSA